VPNSDVKDKSATMGEKASKNDKKKKASKNEKKNKAKKETN